VIPYITTAAKVVFAELISAWDFPGEPTISSDCATWDAMLKSFPIQKASLSKEV